MSSAFEVLRSAVNMLNGAVPVSRSGAWVEVFLGWPLRDLPAEHVAVAFQTTPGSGVQERATFCNDDERYEFRVFVTTRADHPTADEALEQLNVMSSAVRDLFVANKRPPDLPASMNVHQWQLTGFELVGTPQPEGRGWIAQSIFTVSVHAVPRSF